MKRCSTCNRTYPDDTMSNCPHDGAPLMSAAYSPQGAQPGPPPQGYPPPPPQGYPPPPQGYPPPGYPPQNYPPAGYPPPQFQQSPAGWPGAVGMSGFVACPRCASPDPEQVKFTWWGGLLGPKLLKHVKCRGCAMTYNGKTGQPNTTNIIIYSVILGVIAFVVFFLIFSAM